MTNLYSLVPPCFFSGGLTPSWAWISCPVRVLGGSSRYFLQTGTGTWEEGDLTDGLRSAGLGDELSWDHPDSERLEALGDGGPCLVDLRERQVRGCIVLEFCHPERPGTLGKVLSPFLERGGLIPSYHLPNASVPSFRWLYNIPKGDIPSPL